MATRMVCDRCEKVHENYHVDIHSSGDGNGAELPKEREKHEKNG